VVSSDDVLDGMSIPVVKAATKEEALEKALTWAYPQDFV
jgi:hypothetical protein